MQAGDLRRSFARFYDAAWAKPAAPRLARGGFLVLLLVIAVWAAASLAQSLDALPSSLREGRDSAMARDIDQHSHRVEPEMYDEH